VREGDPAEVRRLVGASEKRVNMQDQQGNTALHYAYHAGRDDVARELIALGANQQLFNGNRLTPPQMIYIRQAEDQLTELARLLDPDTGWRDPSRARDLYDQLRAAGSHVVTLALSNLVAGTPVAEQRRPMLLAGIKLGDGVLAGALTDMLRRFGTRQIAEDYAGSGSPFLEQAAAHWSKKPHGQIAGTAGPAGAPGPAEITRGSERAEWGKF
jgi:hypothetical protein